MSDTAVKEMVGVIVNGLTAAGVLKESVNLKDVERIVAKRLSFLSGGTTAAELIPEIVEEIQILGSLTEYPDRYRAEHRKVVDKMDVLQFLVRISNIKDYRFADTPTFRNSERSGWLTRIRPADSEKTYRGIYIGEIAQSCYADVSDEAITLRQRDYVPTIFVPDLNKTLLGTESCWSFVDEPKVQPITDQEIENRWYVRRLGNRGNNTLRVLTGEGNGNDI